MGTSLYDTSAIGSLLQQLTQGGPQVTPSAQPQMPMAPPQAAQLPPQQQVEQPQSLFQRVLSNIKGIPGAISNFERPKLPGEYQAAIDAGLITQQQAASARPGFLESLVADHQPGGSYGQYRNNLAGVLGIKQLAQGIQQQQAMQQMRQSDQALQMQPGEQPQQMIDRLRQHAVYLAQHGDIEGVAKVGQAIKDMAVPNADKSYEPQLFQGPNGQFRWVAPQAGVDVPEGFKPISKPGQAGTPQLFERTSATPKDMPAYVGVSPGDNDALAKYSALGYKPRVEVTTQFVQDALQGRYDEGRYDKSIKDFQGRLKDLGITKAAPVLNQAILTIDNARNEPDVRVRKVLFASSIANFVQAADPKAQIRWQLLNYFKENINASAEDRVRLLVKRLKDGTLPDSVLYGMAQHLQNIKRMMQSEIATTRAAFVKEHPGVAGLDQTLQDQSAYFPEAQTSSAPSGSTTGKKTVVVNGKTFIVP